MKISILMSFSVHVQYKKLLGTFAGHCDFQIKAFIIVSSISHFRDIV